MFEEIQNFFRAAFPLKEFNERYNYLGRLGQGGFGEVWLVEDKRLQKRYVAKRLSPFDNKRVSRSPTQMTRFLREARVMAKLDHPNIVPIVNFIPDPPSNYYIIMAYAEYGTLHDLLKVYQKGLPIDKVIRIGQQICDALDTVHNRGILHRDIKLSNVLVHKYNTNGDLKIWLSDFGLALEEEEIRLTHESKVGTPLYMAPEQHLGEYTVKTDIYALGVLIYRLLTNQSKPIADYQLGDNTSLTPPSYYHPEIPKALDQVVLKSLNKYSEERFETAKEFFQALSEIDVDAVEFPTPFTDLKPTSNGEKFDDNSIRQKDIELSSKTLSTTNEVVWEYNLEAEVLAIPVIDRTCIYLCNKKGKVIAIPRGHHAKNSSKWEIELQTSVTGGLELCRERLLVPGSNGVLYQIRVADGEIEKEYSIGGLLRAKPLVIDRLAYIVTDISEDFNGGAGQLAIIDIPRKELTIQQVCHRGLAVQPTLLNGILYIGGRSAGKADLYAISEGSQVPNVVAEINRSVGSIIADSQNQCLYIADISGKIYTFSISGKLDLFYDVKVPVRADIVMGNNTLYVGTKTGKLYALNPKTPWFRWGRQYAWDPFDAGSTVRQILATSEYIYVLNGAGEVFALIHSGQMVWKLTDRDQHWTMMMIDYFFEDLLYLTDNSGHVVAIVPDLG